MRKKILFLCTIIVSMIYSFLCFEKLNHAFAETSREKTQAGESADYGFDVDEKLYDINWTERRYFNLRCDKSTIVQSINKRIKWEDKKKIGMVEMHVGYATSYAAIDGKIYQRVMYKTETLPCIVRNTDGTEFYNGRFFGYVEELIVEIGGLDYNVMRNVEIFPKDTSEKTTVYTYSCSSQLGGGLDIGWSDKGLSFTGKGSFSSSISCTRSFSQGPVTIVTNRDAGDVAYWQFDYNPDYVQNPQNVNKDLNKCFRENIVERGILSWNTPNNRCFKVDMNVYVKGTFGIMDTKANNMCIPVLHDKTDFEIGWNDQKFEIHQYDEYTHLAY